MRYTALGLYGEQSEARVVPKKTSKGPALILDEAAVELFGTALLDAVESTHEDRLDLFEGFREGSRRFVGQDAPPTSRGYGEG